MKKQINEVTKNKKHYDPNRHCYMDKDGNYVYQIMQYNDKGKLVPANVIIERDKDNTDLIELLNQMDIKEYACYEREERHLAHYAPKAIDSEGHEITPEDISYTEPVEAIADEKSDAFNVLFGDEELEDEEKEKLITKVQEFIRTLSNDQYDLYYRHIVEGRTFSEICEEDGNKVTVKAYQRRWVKIRNRASKFFGKKLSGRFD